jgi:hypothetical protein
MPVIPATLGNMMVLAFLDIKQQLISKITNTKRAGRVVQVVECLPSRHKPSSTLSTTKKVLHGHWPAFTLGEI